MSSLGDQPWDFCASWKKQNFLNHSCRQYVRALSTGIHTLGEMLSWRFIQYTGKYMLVLPMKMWCVTIGDRQIQMRSHAIMWEWTSFILLMLAASRHMSRLCKTYCWCLWYKYWCLKLNLVSKLYCYTLWKALMVSTSSDKFPWLFQYCKCFFP